MQQIEKKGRGSREEILILHESDDPRGVLPRILCRLHIGRIRMLDRQMLECFDRNLEASIRGSRGVRSSWSAFARHGFEAIRHVNLSFRTTGVVSARGLG